MDMADCERESEKEKLEENSNRPEQEEKENEGKGEDVKDEKYSYVGDESSDDEMDREKMEEYSKQVTASDGFDVDDFSKWDVCGLIVLILNFDAQPRTYKKLLILSELATSKFNQENGAYYKFVRVVKANGQFVGGFQFYITFEAKDPKFDVNTFQALTYSGIPDANGNPEYSVEFCRPKITNELKVIGDVATI